MDEEKTIKNNKYLKTGIISASILACGIEGIPLDKKLHVDKQPHLPENPIESQELSIENVVMHGTAQKITSYELPEGVYIKAHSKDNSGQYILVQKKPE